MRPPLTEQEQLQIIELYKTGNYSYKDLAKRFNKCHQAIYRCLKSNNIKARPMNYINEQQIDEMVSLFQTGLYTYVDLGKKFGITGTQVGRLFSKRGIKARSLSEIFRKYPIKEDYFDNMDSPEKLYFLGWLYSDGYNNIRNNAVQLSLKEDDKDILVKLNNLIQPTKPLGYIDMSKQRERPTSFRNSKNCYRLSIVNKHISQRLVELGVTQAKTFTITFPEWIEEPLLGHFIRGIMDGDGCICKNLRQAEVSLTGTLSFCTRLGEILKQRFDIDVEIKARHPERNNTIRQLRLKGGLDKIMLFLDWIYKDSTIHLQRKYDLYLALKQKQLSKIKPLVTSSI